MSDSAPPSFSAARRWNISLNVLLAVAAVLALVAMANYLAARHFLRLSWSDQTQTRLSPLTQRVLAGLTNEVKVIVYFDKHEPLYDAVWSLLKEYKFSSAKISVELVDYLTDPAGAQLVKSKYHLSSQTDKNLIIFDCQGRPRIIYDSELSDLDLEPLVSGKSREVRRTHFKGELLFTSALMSVTSSRSLKAYFLQGHREHRLDSDDAIMGYSRFAGLLKDNNIQVEPLTLLGEAEVPADCHLLIIAGPQDALPEVELNKIDRYLKQGGRLLALFNFYGVEKQLGLEKILQQWGVTVGHNVVLDEENTITGQDLLLTQFTGHPLIRSLYGSRLYLLLPRSISKASTAGGGADAPQVEPLAVSGEKGRVITEVKNNGLFKTPDDFVGSVPLMAAVEKGGLRGVSADRGATRLVVVGDSIFLGNETIDKAANREFAGHAINWLLARNELVGSLGPRPIKDYKVIMSQSQLAGVQWLLLLGMPGGVLLVGGLVWMKRRH